MKPGTLPLRPQSRPLCQLCDYILQQPASRRSFVNAAAPVWRRQAAKHAALLPRIPARTQSTSRNTQERESQLTKHQWAQGVAALKARLAEVEKHIARIKSSPKVEPEEATLEALAGLEWIVRSAIAIRSNKPLPGKMDIRLSSAGSILSLGRDDRDTLSVKQTPSKPVSADGIPSPQYLSRLAEDLLKDAKVFISPAVLAQYIRLQRLVGNPRAIPEILFLYAHKPVPELGSSPPKYAKPSPKSAKQAIPPELADEALTAAIEAKNMPLALDVVQVTYCAPAWRRQRMLTKLGIPGVLAGLTPLALYMVAQEMSVYSGFIEPWLFKVYAFLGLSTYVLCTGTLGFVALTTYNDNHNRVAWRPGTPLLDRYMREDERAALDRIACAWGFKEDWKRGDEEGEEWEGLRELISIRGMILDKPDLMPGMNA